MSVFEERSVDEGDSSTRFLKYVLNLSGFTSYMKLSSIPAFLETKEAFCHKCIISDDEYLAEIAKPEYEGGPFGFQVPEKHRIKRILPPQLKTMKRGKVDDSKWQAMRGAFEDAMSHNVVFPMILEKKENMCENSDDTLKHEYVLVYRKNIDEAVILDDLYLSMHRLFAYKWIARETSENSKKNAPFALQMFIKPYIKSWTGNTNVKFHVPFPNEVTFTKIMKILDTNKTTFREAYRAYVVMYIDMIQRYPEAKHDEIQTMLKDIIDKEPNMIHDAIARLNAHNAMYLSKHKAGLIKQGHLINLESRKEHTAKARTQRIKATVQSPDSIKLIKPYPVRDLSSITRIQRNTYKIMKFMEFKHPNCRLIYKLQWTYDSDLDEWDLVEPDDFEEQWDDAMKNKSVRFICMYISIVADEEDASNHANIAIYDKVKNTLERFEPNSSKYLEDREERDVLLNQALTRLNVIETLNPVFFAPEEYCPFSPHSEEGKEFKELFQYHGGSCAIWTAWYMDLRMSNPNSARAKTLERALNYIKDLGSFKLFANSYRAYLKQGNVIVRNIKTDLTPITSRKARSVPTKVSRTASTRSATSSTSSSTAASTTSMVSTSMTPSNKISFRRTL